MELGQTVCLPNNPDCDSCPVHSKCLAFANKSQAVSPAPKAKKDFIQENLVLHIPVNRGKIGLIRRDQSSKFLKNTLGFHTRHLKSLPGGAIATVSHNITHHKITAAVTSSPWDPKGDSRDFTWLTPDQVEARLVSNLDRKAWHAYLKRDKSP